MKALRIHHEKRIKARVRRDFWCFWHHWEASEERKKRVCGILARTHARCSCYGCGNPRKYTGERKRQELIHIINLKEGIGE